MKTNLQARSRINLQDNASHSDSLQLIPHYQCDGPKRISESDCSGDVVIRSDSILFESDEAYQDLVLPYPNLFIWKKKKYCELLNKDFSFFGRAVIQVCTPDKACNKNVIGDTDVGVMFVSKHKSPQMTTILWPLLRTRLKGGRHLLDIIILCFDAAYNDFVYYIGL